MEPEQIEHTILGPDIEYTQIHKESNSLPDEGRVVVPMNMASASRQRPAKTITVANFPFGDMPKRVVEDQVRAVDEEVSVHNVDVMVPQWMFDSEETIRKYEWFSDVADAAGRGMEIKAIVEPNEHTSARAVGSTCEAAIEAGFDYLKTCTGFHGNEATESSCRLLGEWGSVKASGGIRTLEQAEELMEVPAVDRIGTSSGIKILEDMEE